MNYSITYAQNREDLIIGGFLKHIKNGFYVDVGANDPDVFSVTRRFYMSGWRGINIEPSQKLYTRLALKRTRDINLMIGVGSTNKKELFREYPKGDGLSTFSESMKKAYEKSGYEPAREYVDITVPIRTLASVFEEYSVDKIDFLKIDIEGYEYEAIIGNNWKKYRPTLLCIEANHVDKDWRPFLMEQGYHLVFFDGLNEYYIANESEKLAKDFVYSEAVLNRDYISPQLYETLRSNKGEVRKLNDDMAIKHQSLIASLEYSTKLEQQIRDIHQRLGEQDYYIWQSRRLKKSFKIFVQALDGALRANIIRFENRFLERKTKSTQGVSERKILLSNNRNRLLSAIKAYDYETNLNSNGFEQLLSAERRYIVDIEDIYLKITRGVIKKVKKQ